jgi:hypothetical protein
MKVRHVAGEDIVITQSPEAADMTKVIALNESALHLYNALQERDFTMQDVVDTLLEAYDVDADTARRDAEAWVAEMQQNLMITD